MSDPLPENIPPPPSQLHKLFLLARKILYEERPWVRHTCHFLFEEGRAMKRGWALFFVILLVAIWFISKFYNYKTEVVIQGMGNDFTNQLASANATFLSSNSFLLGQIESLEGQVSGIQKKFDDSKRDNEAQIINLKMDIQRITGERDNALMRERIAENLPDTASFMYSNVNATASNFISELGLVEPDFKIKINGISVTNLSPLFIPLDKTRRIFLQISPLAQGEPSIEDLRIDFSLPLDQTNLIIGDQWQSKGHDFDYNGMSFNYWETTTGGSLLTSKRGFDSTSFCISTNVNPSILVTRIDIFAPRVIGVQTFVALFIIQ